MLSSKSRTEFDKLPEKVKEAVKTIQEHKKEIAKFGRWYAKLTSVYLVFAIALGAAGKLVGVVSTGGTALLTTGVMGRGFLKEHAGRFRKEYLALYKALLAEKENPAVKQLLEKNPYIVVGKKGDLVGKKTLPKIRRQPIGRRRVTSPNAGKEKVRKWRKRYLPKLKRKKK